MTKLPAEIQVEDLLPGSVLFVLPRRELTAFRFLGLVFLGLGMSLAGFFVFWVYQATRGFQLAKIDLGEMIAAGMGGLILIPASLALGLGLLMFFGHSEIEIRDGVLRAIERAGPIRWTRSEPVERIRRFSVFSAPESVRRSSGMSGAGTLGAIGLDIKGAKSMFLAPGYPHEWLRPLADTLAAHCQKSAADAFTGAGESEPAAIEVVEVSLDQPAPDLPVLRPSNSRVVVETFPDGVTLKVPAAGLWRGSKGLIGFAVIWTGAVSVFSFLFLFAGPPAGKDLAIMACVLGLFWAVGITSLLGAINMGRRTAALAVVEDKLLVMQTGLFGAKRREWTRNQITHICRGETGMRVNNRPVLELQIHSGGKKFGLLSGREDDELAWLASVLRQSLRIEANPRS